MTHAFPRPIAVVLSCFLFAGGVGVAGSQMASAPASSVRVALPPSTTVTTQAATTSTSTTLPPTTTTLAPTTTTAAPVTTTLAKRVVVPRTRTTVPSIECTFTRTYPDYGGFLITVHLPTLPSRHGRIWINYDNLDLGGTSAKWTDAITDASGFAGANFQLDRWMGKLNTVMFEDRDGSGFTTCSDSGATP